MAGGFTTHDSIVNALSALGQVRRGRWNKNSHGVAAVAGEMSCLFHSAGNPTNGVLTGVNRTFNSLCEESVGAIRHGGPVDNSLMKKHGLANSGGSGAVTTAPHNLILVDLLGFVPLTSVSTTGAQAVTDTATFTADTVNERIVHAGLDVADFSRVVLSTTTALPGGLAAGTVTTGQAYFTRRFSSTESTLYPTYVDAVAQTNAVNLTSAGTGTHTLRVTLPRYFDGADIDVFATVTATMGAGTPSMSIGYTNSGGISARATPTTLPIGKTAAGVGLVPYSGTGLGKYGPSFPRQGNDKGVQRIESVNLSATYTSGTLSYVAYKELAEIPNGAVGIFTERDLVNQISSMPEIQDGACLALLLFNGAATPANSGFTGSLISAWN